MTLKQIAPRFRKGNAKTIAAFMTAEDGTLFICVAIACSEKGKYQRVNLVEEKKSCRSTCFGVSNCS